MPIRVALVAPFSMSFLGLWSHKVDSMQFTRIDMTTQCQLSRDALKSDGYNVIVVMDSDISKGRVIKGDSKVPLLYIVKNSTLTPAKYRMRYKRIGGLFPDLILVDHDTIPRFSRSGRPVKRFLECVNGRFLSLRDWKEKTTDIGFYGSDNPLNSKYRWEISRFCEDLGVNIDLTPYTGDKLLKAIMKTKIMVNVESSERSLNPLVYSALYTGGLVLSSKLPKVSWGVLKAGKTHLEYTSPATMSMSLTRLVNDEVYARKIAQGGREAVKGLTWDNQALTLAELITPLIDKEKHEQFAFAF